MMKREREQTRYDYTMHGLTGNDIEMGETVRERAIAKQWDTERESKREIQGARHREKHG